MEGSQKVAVILEVDSVQTTNYTVDQLNFTIDPIEWQSRNMHWVCTQRVLRPKELFCLLNGQDIECSDKMKI